MAQSPDPPHFTTPDFLLESGNTFGTLSFSPDGNKLAVSTIRGVTLWDTATGEPGSTFSQGAPMRYIKFSPDGSLLIGSNAFYEIYVWNTSTENLVGVIEFGQWIRDFDIAPDNDKIVVNWVDVNDNSGARARIVVFSINAALSGEGGNLILSHRSIDLSWRLSPISGAFDLTGRFCRWVLVVAPNATLISLNGTGFMCSIGQTVLN